MNLKYSNNLMSSSTPILSSISKSAPPTPSTSIIVKIAIPSHGLQKALRCLLSDTVWNLKKQLLEKTSNEIPNALNYGFFLPGTPTSPGKFLDEKRELFSYKLENTISLEFVQKCRVPQTGSPSACDFDFTPAIKKRNKALIEEVTKGNIEKVRERCKVIDPNCWADEEGSETPLIAAIMNEDREIMNLLLECGAHLDFKVGAKEQWKSPLHVAAVNNKTKATQLLLAAGAWANISDSLGLTPLYYAATHGNKEIAHRLLTARAATEIFDENGRGPLHQACLNNHDQVTWLLIDFGANMNSKNISGNTPLHVSASRNSVDCAKWLLLRGANKTMVNKANQLAAQVAMISQNSTMADLINNHKDEDIVPAPPMPPYSDIGELPEHGIGAASIIKSKGLGAARRKLIKMILSTDSLLKDDDSASEIDAEDAKSILDLDNKSIMERDEEGDTDISPQISPDVEPSLKAQQIIDELKLILEKSATSDNPNNALSGMERDLQNIIEEINSKIQKAKKPLHMI